MIVALKNLVWVENPDKVDYLAPILDVLKRQKSALIATLNYDNSIELLAKSRGVPFTTGIEQWSKSGSFVLPEEGLFILKLHGSIDWSWETRERSSKQVMPHRSIRTNDFERAEDRYFQPAVIFGQRNKLTADGPFLDLLRCFREQLFKASDSHSCRVLVS